MTYELCAQATPTRTGYYSRLLISRFLDSNTMELYCKGYSSPPWKPPATAKSRPLSGHLWMSFRESPCQCNNTEYTWASKGLLYHDTGLYVWMRMRKLFGRSEIAHTSQVVKGWWRAPPLLGVRPRRRLCSRRNLPPTLCRAARVGQTRRLPRRPSTKVRST